MLRRQEANESLTWRQRARVVSVLDSQPGVPEFESRPRLYTAVSINVVGF